MAKMLRFCLFFSLFTAILTIFNEPVSAADTGLISRDSAENHGLTRAWFMQTRLDPGRDRVEKVILAEKSANHPDTLFVQTRRAGLHVIDAETGQTLWVKTVGRPNHPSLPLGVNEQMVSVVNGKNLYILNRENGKILWSGEVSDVPTAGVIMCKRRVFIPTMNGRIIGYKLQKIADELPLPKIEQEKTGEDKTAKVDKAEQSQESDSGSLRLKQGPLPEVACGSSGMLGAQPIIVRDDDLGTYLAWTTSKGMFVAHIDRQDDFHFPLLYELAGSNEIAAQPAYMPPKNGNPDLEGVIFVATMSGAIFAHSERQGTEIWRQAIGRPIVEAVVVIENRLYAVSALGGMYCLDAADGSVNWTAPNVMKFIAQSPTRIYAADKFDRLLVLDAETGNRIDTLPFSAADIMVGNARTDRIYLISKTGLVQCLHETELEQPFRHALREETKEPKPEENKADKPEEEKDQPKEEEDKEDPFA